MPRLYSHFHYRSIDVSSIKELVRRWFPKEYHSAPRKRFIHRTIEDIEDSIAELKYTEQIRLENKKATEQESRFFAIFIYHNHFILSNQSNKKKSGITN